MGIKKLIEKSKYRQIDIAKKLGVSKQLVSFWSSGQSEPRLKDIVTLAKILNVSIEEVVVCFVERR